jgi:hypothetical protein
MLKRSFVLDSALESSEELRDSDDDFDDTDVADNKNDVADVIQRRKRVVLSQSSDDSSRNSSNSEDGDVFETWSSVQGKCSSSALPTRRGRDAADQEDREYTGAILADEVR